MKKIPFYLSLEFIAFLFFLSFLLIPIPIAIFLLIKRKKIDKERNEQLENYYSNKQQLDEIKNNIDSSQERLNQIKTELADEEIIYNKIVDAAKQIGEKEKQAIVDTATEEINKIFKNKDNVIQEKNNQIVLLDEKYVLKKQEIQQLTKEIIKLQRDARKYRSDAMALKHIQQNHEYIKLNYREIEGQLEKNISKISENELLESVITLHTHSENSKELRKLSTQTRKEIEKTLNEFLSRYTTKTFKSMYNLMVLGLQSEIQLILFNLKFGTLKEAVTQVKDVIQKYQIIAGKGNQSVLPTITKFLLSMEAFYIELVHIEYKYYIRREMEKEEQRQLREQMKQEAEERKLLEAERRKLEREESKFITELNRTNQLLESETDQQTIDTLKARISELEQQMAEIETQKENIASLANGKAGYVYIISNLGSFGEDIFKIGMTRRLEPQDRIDELSSASVPFKFDVHAFIFSNDAVGLEFSLHQRLQENRVNKVNYRKEFFRTSIDDLEKLVEELDPTADFERTMLALEFKQTQTLEQQINKL